MTQTTARLPRSITCAIRRCSDHRRDDRHVHYDRCMGRRPRNRPRLFLSLCAASSRMTIAGGSQPGTPIALLYVCHPLHIYKVRDQYLSKSHRCDHHQGRKSVRPRSTLVQFFDHAPRYRCSPTSVTTRISYPKRATLKGHQLAMLRSRQFLTYAAVPHCTQIMPV